MGEWGNSPAEDKMQGFVDLPGPRTFYDLRLLIGLFGFYREWLPCFELQINPFRDILRHSPPPGAVSEGDPALLIGNRWTPQHQEILNSLKRAILDRPVLQRVNPDLPFYVKTDWCKWGMAAALLQPDASDEAQAAIRREASGEPCEFDKHLSKLRLRPLCFLSRKTTKPEQSYHSYQGEASTGVWAIDKLRVFLWGNWFGWMTDCEGLLKFFESDDLPTHAMQRWKMTLLQYHFDIIHRPSRYMKEVDALSRYNAMVTILKNTAALDLITAVAMARTAPPPVTAPVQLADPEPPSREPASLPPGWQPGWTNWPPQTLPSPRDLSTSRMPSSA